MLVLSRKMHERIQIGENIIVTVVGIRGHIVRLGIEAPREVPVARLPGVPANITPQPKKAQK